MSSSHQNGEILLDPNNNQPSVVDPKKGIIENMENTMKDLTFEDLVRGTTPADIEQRCFDLCQSYLGGSWAQATSAADLEVKRISGGMTNQLYHVKLRDSVVRVPNVVYPEEPEEVAIKLYQAKHMKSYHEEDSERLSDIIVLTIVSQVGIGPKVFGIFSDGVILAYHKHEQFRVKHQQNLVLLKELAGILARIHHLSVPIRKDNNWLMKELRSMIDLGYSTTDIPPLVQELNLDQFKRRDLAAEFEDFEQFVQKQNAPLVFCHNDFRGSNMLVTEPDQKILLCDLEYASYGPRGFDLAVFLTEWDRELFDMANFGAPPNEPIEKFVKLYLEAVDQLKPGYSKEPGNSLKEVVDEVKLYILVNFMFFLAFMMKQTESLIPQMPFDPKSKMVFVNKIYTTYFEIKDKLVADGVISNNS